MNSIRYFLVGVLLMAGVHITLSLSSCSKDSNPVDPEWQQNVDLNKIKAGAQTIEDAFAASDTSKILQCMTPTARTRYSSSLSTIKSRIPAFVSAFKQRSLVSYSERYAEYAYTVNGMTYTIALGRQDDESWKLIRF